MTRNDIPWWAGTFCPRCGREFSEADTRRNEWQEITSAGVTPGLVCPNCLTDADMQTIADSVITPE